jgi:catecholate siderophore receptor
MAYFRGRSHLRAGLVATGAAGALLSGAAHAADGGEMHNVVVTAQRATDKPLGLGVLPDSIQDTPQGVVVIDQSTLRDQGVASLQQALKNVPGITVAIGEGGSLNGDQFKFRGLDASNDVYIDGLRDFGVYTRDSFDAQDVQVIEGPSGAAFGRGTTGAAINVVSKMPSLANAADVAVSAGNGSYYRGTADLNLRINDSTAVRLNLMGNSNHVVDRDEVRSRRWGAAAAIGFGLGGPTIFTINVLHQRDDRRPDYGVILLAPAGPSVGAPGPAQIALPATEFGVPRNTFYGYTADADRTKADILTFRFRRLASEALTFASDGRIGVYSRYFQYTPVDNCTTTPTPENGAGSCIGNFVGAGGPASAFVRMGGGGPYRMNTWGAQNISTLKWSGGIAGLKNEFVAGWDLSYQNSRKTTFAYSPTRNGTGTAPLIPALSKNLRQPSVVPTVAVVLPTPANIAGTNDTLASTLYTNGDSSDAGGFVYDRLWLTPRWSIVGALRADRYRLTYTNITVGGTATTIPVRSAIFTPKASLVFEPTDDQTYYLSYAKSATPPGTALANSNTPVTAAASVLDPEVNESFEAGAKIRLLHGALALTAAVFEVRKNNAVQADPNTGEILTGAFSGDKQEIRGVQVGIAGRLNADWQVSGGYTYLDARTRQSFTACSALTAASTSGVACPPGVAVGAPQVNRAVIGTQIAYAPRHAATIWSTYDLRRLIPGLSIGGGAVYQSRVVGGYSGVTPLTGAAFLTKIAQEPYSLEFDGLVTYDFGRYRIALNGYNLANRLNYSQVYNNRAVPSPGRSAVLTVGARF